jgi:hypothetical protein
MRISVYQQTNSDRTDALSAYHDLVSMPSTTPMAAQFMSHVTSWGLPVMRDDVSFLAHRGTTPRQRPLTWPTTVLRTKCHGRCGEPHACAQPK